MTLLTRAIRLSELLRAPEASLRPARDQLGALLAAQARAAAEAAAAAEEERRAAAQRAEMRAELGIEIAVPNEFLCPITQECAACPRPRRPSPAARPPPPVPAACPALLRLHMRSVLPLHVLAPLRSGSAGS